MLRFCLAQLNSHVGNLEKNLQKALNACEQAYANQAKVIVFPEVFLIGYLPQDLLYHENFLHQSNIYLQKLIDKTKHLDLYIIIGHIRLQKADLYNSAYVIYQGRILFYYDKQHLPNYGVFDEKRYFKAGETSCIFNIENTSVEIIICEDIWHAKQSSSADICICINASPFTLNKHQLRIQQLTKHKQNTIYVNLVGGQDELVFDGNSFISDDKCNIVANLTSFKEEIAYIDWCDNNKSWINTFNLPSICENNQMHNIYNALVLGTKDYIHKNGFKSVVIGLSGGVDSALVACIAVEALGAENVHTIMLPSMYTADISLIDAQQLASNLKISYEVIEIKAIYESFIQQLPFYSATINNQNTNDISLENLQARIRGMILMAYSNKNNSLVLTTGNKSEIAVGYCTLYGDMAGAFAPIKDLTKTQIYELCKDYNQKHNNLIPQRILTRPPSAELRPNQTDQDSLPDYVILDLILVEYIENKLSSDEISLEYNLEVNLVNKIISLVNISEYKRQQSAIGIKISNCAFGKDWRYSISNKFS